MTTTDCLLISNNKRLQTSFSYDLITTQMHLLARRSEDFSKPPSKNTIRLAHLLLNRLLNYTGDEISLKEKLLGIQAKELINDYMQYCCK